MNEFCKYEYKETPNLDLLVITFFVDKRYEGNQDKVFSNVIRMISSFEDKATISNININNINKFLKLAKHIGNLDIRDFL